MNLGGTLEPEQLAHRNFAQFQGATEGELVGWLRQILASRLAKLLRHYYGTRRRDIRLERDLVDHLEHLP
jgi:RNA polymerase sigma-70 factor (ECF subfamily)